MPICMICNQPMQVLFNVSYFCPPCENIDKPIPGSNWKPIKGTGWLYQYLEGAVNTPEDSTHGWWVASTEDYKQVLDYLLTTDVIDRCSMWEINAGNKLEADDKLLVFKRRVTPP